MNFATLKIGLLGAGNMGSAILEGLLNRHLVEPARVFVCDAQSEKAEIFAREWAVNRAASALELTKQSDIILLAIKPQDFENAATQIRSGLTAEKVLISILAGADLKRLKDVLACEVTLVRAMPNLAAKVAQSLTALTGDSEAALSAAEQIFCGCGKTLRLDEKYFDLFTALSGSGPAYFFLLMEALEAKACAAGLDKTTAGLIASQTALGASLTAQSSRLSSGELREMVTSKGGTTAAALDVLNQADIQKIYSDAFDAATHRSRELRESKS